MANKIQGFLHLKEIHTRSKLQRGHFISMIDFRWPTQIDHIVIDQSALIREFSPQESPQHAVQDDCKITD